MAVIPIVSFAEKRGETLDYLITVSGVDLTVPGTKLWFTGKVSKNSPDNQAIWQKTIANGGVVVTGATTATATLQPTDTANLADGTGVYYDVQVETSTGRVQTAFEGSITFEIDVTQST